MNIERLKDIEAHHITGHLQEDEIRELIEAVKNLKAREVTGQDVIWASEVHDFISDYEGDAETPDEELALQMDGYKHCLIGLGRQGPGSFLLIYDSGKVIETLIERDGMNYEEAVEFYEFNQVGAWCGKGTPILLEIAVDHGAPERN